MFDLHPSQRIRPVTAIALRERRYGAASSVRVEIHTRESALQTFIFASVDGIDQDISTEEHIEQYQSKLKPLLSDAQSDSN